MTQNISSEQTPVDRFHEEIQTPAKDVELSYAGVKSFLKSDIRDVTDIADRDVAVLGAPYDGAVSNRPGARYGPEAIRESSAWLAYLSGYKGGLTSMRTENQIDYDNLSIADCGDVPVFPMDRVKTAASIRAHVATVASQETMPVLLGGDHYCTYPAFCGVAKGGNYDSLGLVQIDAHTDTSQESAVFGEHFHGSSTHHIAASEYADYEHVGQVGIRGYEAPNFFEFADDAGLTLRTMVNVEEQGIRSAVHDAIDAAATGTDGVYVTFDIDALDPSFAPGTGTPEPGGLSAYQALTVMEVLGTSKDVIATDLMEVAPTHDPTGNTSRIGTYLLITLLERLFAEESH